MVAESMNTPLFLADEQASVDAGRRFGLALSPGAVVYLHGELGAGKTTLCRGILAAFGYEGPVKSPTYTLVEPYALVECTINHFDLYRLGDPEELDLIGIRDYFDDQQICLVEWPDRGQGYLPEPDITLSLAYSAQGRQLSWRHFSKLGAQIIGRFG